jgi:hypothetical protein
MSDRKIYLYNDWHNGDIISNRALIRELAKSNLDITVGSYRNRYYLVADLPVNHLVAEIDENSPFSPSLINFCPEGFIPINSWCGTFKDIDDEHHHNWEAIVKTWNRQAEIHRLNYFLSQKYVPMFDFHYVCRFQLQKRALFIENGPVRSGHCHFEFDIHKISSLFPEFTYYCTSNKTPMSENVVNCGNRNLVELSFISNLCEAIIGKGSGPFLATYTENNRFKPRAVINFEGFPFWNYPNNPLRYLNGEYELLNYLSALRDNPAESI